MSVSPPPVPKKKKQKYDKKKIYYMGWLQTHLNDYVFN